MIFTRIRLVNFSLPLAVMVHWLNHVQRLPSDPKSRWKIWVGAVVFYTHTFKPTPLDRLNNKWHAITTKTRTTNGRSILVGMNLNTTQIIQSDSSQMATWLSFAMFLLLATCTLIQSLRRSQSSTMKYRDMEIPPSGTFTIIGGSRLSMTSIKGVKIKWRRSIP